MAAGARTVLRRARVCVCVLGRLGRDLNIYELCSTRTRRVYLALCSSPLPRHTLSHSLAPAPRPANLHGSGRAAGWPRPPPRPGSCPNEAAATGKRLRTTLHGRSCAGRGPRNLGRAVAGLARLALGGGARGSGLTCHPPHPRAARLSPLLCVSVERRPQEAAPRKAVTDRSAQRQTSKEGA